MAHWPRLGVVVGITALVGCGSPPPDHSASGDTAGSAVAGPAADQPARQAPMQTSPLGPTAQQAPKLGASITDKPRVTSTDARAQTAASPADTQQLGRQAEFFVFQVEHRGLDWIRLVVVRDHKERRRRVCGHAEAGAEF